MPLSSPANIILPGWRQGRLLFFTSITDKYTTRLDYRVAAATKPGETRVMRSYKAPISAEDLAKCQATADNGAELQMFFQAMGQGNLDELTDETRLHLPPCAKGCSPLIYTCSYFNFLRKYSVDQALVQHYEASTPKERFSSESSLSIYKILSAHLQPTRAAALLDADIPKIDAVKGPGATVANLLREAAIIRHDTGAEDLAIQTMQRAVSLHNTEDKWRRLADFAIAADRPDEAIGFYEKAEALSPLPPPPALRMARLLVNAARPEEAEPFLERAETAFPKPVKTLRQQMAAAM